MDGDACRMSSVREGESLQAGRAVLTGEEESKAAARTYICLLRTSSVQAGRSSCVLLFVIVIVVVVVDYSRGVYKRGACHEHIFQEQHRVERVLCVV